MEPLFFLMILTGIAGLARCFAQASDAARRTAEARWRLVRPVWQRAATLVGGQFRSGPGRLGEPRMQISVELESVALLVDHDVDHRGVSGVRYMTRITSTARNPSGLRLRVHEQRLRGAGDGGFRGRLVDVGNLKADGAFVVRASSPTLARWWLTPRLRAALRAAAEYQLTLEAHRLTSIRAGLEDDAERLVRALHAAALVAGRGRELAKAWRALAQELGGSLSTGATTVSGGEVTIELEHRGRLVSVMLGRSARNGQLGTRVSVARVASPSERFALKRRARRGSTRGRSEPPGDDALLRAYEVQASAPEKVALRFTDELAREVLALRPSAILGNEAAVTLVFSELETGREPIERAIAIVSALAAPGPHGPYR
ncbi:uncharacterized protein SOCEGT47_042900 [Sorangium cellulosum]|uniref:Uncharacterized protein n=1 Tax=Sorangium cellulosum TaxID=56 RepID=A0A4P2Q375_SORCE|nr:hypothetical protein [Sorangium cellulosum]AUX23760.1 uncharacterized protein SOCEGT47_042900 [Sorangium cellulosum]